MPCDFANSSAPSRHQQNVRRLLHHQPRQMDGIGDVLHRRDGPGLQRAPVHDGGVHFRHAILGVVGAAARVIEAGIFHHADGSFHGVQAGAATREYRVSGSNRFHHADRDGLG